MADLTSGLTMTVSSLFGQDRYDPVETAIREAKHVIETSTLPTPNPHRVLRELKGVARMMYVREMQRREQELAAEGAEPPPPWGLKVNLSNLCIGPTHAESVARSMILNETVTTLDLSMCDLGTDGAVAVVHCLQKNKALEHLVLNGNFMGPPVAIKAAHMLSLPTCFLQSLSVSCNSIGDEGAIALASALRVNKQLTFLNVRSNGITDAGATALLESMALEHNGTLTALWIQLNPVSPEILAKITDVLVLKCPPPPDTGKKKKKKPGGAGGAGGSSNPTSPRK